MRSDKKSKNEIALNLELIPHSIFDTIIECLLFVLFAYMPLALGVVNESSEFWLLAIVAAMSVCLFVRFLVRPMSFVWSCSYIPLFGFVLLVLFQSIPLPADFVKAISPNTWQVKSELLTALKAPVDYMTLSFSPAVTIQNLRILIAMSLVYVTVVNIYRRPSQLRRLFKGIVVIGGFYALVAFLQDTFGNGKIFWSIPTYDNANSGPFVNHSHYSQYMNLILGFTVGMLMLKMHERIDRGGEVTFFEVMPRLYRPGLRVVWLCGAVMVLGISTIFISLSRAGMLALLISGILTITIMALRRGLYSRSWVITLVSLLSFVCVLYIGFDAVYDRLATLGELEKQSSRWDIVGPIMAAFSQFRLFGTGQGSFDMVYPMFDHTDHAILAGHADIEYAQIIQETGIIGISLIAAFLLCALRHCYLAIISAGRSRCGIPVLITAFGLAYGLLAVIIQSISDFGQRLPGVGMLTLLVCSVLTCFAQLVSIWRKGQLENIGRPTALTRPVAIGGLIVVLALWVWILPQASDAMSAQQHWDNALRLEKHLDSIEWQATNQQYAELINEAQQAAQLAPGNVRYGYGLNSYRWLSISRVADEQGNIIMTDESIGHTKRIVDELLANCVSVPTFGANYTLAGQLQYFVLQDTTAGAENIQRGYKLAPCDPTSCYVAGTLDLEQGRLDDAMAKFAHALKLDGSLVNDIITECLVTIDRPDLAVKLVENNPGWLNTLAYRLSQLAEHKELAEAASQQVIALLEAKVKEKDCPAPTIANLGYMYYRQGEYDNAAEMFKKATAIDYSQISWHYQLALTYDKLGDTDLAIHTARICLRLKATWQPAIKLIEELSTRR